jgi:carbon monoxide dehydrogenase subunit G
VPDVNSSIEIAAPPEAVFDFVDDWQNTMKFLRGLKRWEPLDRAKTQGVGVVFRVKMGAGPVNVDGEMQVKEHDRPHRIVFQTVKGSIKARGEWTFTATGAGTRVDLKNAVELPGGIAGRVIRKVFESQAQKDLDASVRDLKRLVEAGP